VFAVTTIVAPTIAAADHPSLDDAVARFITDLRSETRYFGPSGRRNPKPFPSLLQELEQRGGFRLAAMTGTRVVGLVRVDEGGAVFIAVAADCRRNGIGALLLTAAIERSSVVLHRRLVIRSTHRSRAVRGLGERFGCTALDLGRGRIEIILPSASIATSA
jgi:GNAT superfamily N-acetyltransferase